ncbi:hypothetical protein MOQ72_20235 [Saccharopolyspora sp. K220]|uniref:3-oxoacyl-[acyl-carrier-protein] synthase III C-terminal domain-containing protein n=1 Tax=Saccharopolyspora soli TaxID=2926618 RepID=UPI001F5749A4|nr:3-oxoacyl-[acyl-carrier-protein] synthase III C-terminal domain-containing protein [Saccharopolyspora soli]MCI2419780.1 hypothetical protein [Saccharopolyspora soli]
MDWLVSHPGNGAIIDGIRSSLGEHSGKLRTNYPQRGNFNASCVPSTLSELTRSGDLQPGDLVLSTAVGTGWYYGGLLFEL